MTRGFICLIAVFLQGCYVHRVPGDDLSSLTGKRVRVKSPTPLPVRAQTDTVGTVLLGTVTSVTGSLFRVYGDTLVLDEVVGTAKGPTRNFFLAPTVKIRVVPTDKTEVTLKQFSFARTALLILIPTAVFVGIVASAASQLPVF